MKKVICITGTRAEWGVLKNLLKRMRADDAFDLSLIVTGMHVSRTQGYTLDEVRKSGIPIAGVVDAHVEEVSMAESLGLETVGIARILQIEKPDLVLVIADRDEGLAGAMAAAHFFIPVAHISGGDITTGAIIDERIRHAITRFADIHFAESDQSAKNLIAMGENPELVFAVGNPGVETLQVSEERKVVIAAKFNLDRSKPILIAGQHPVTGEAAHAGAQMQETLEALKELTLQTILIYPNSDTGSVDMIKAIKKYEQEPYLRIVRNIPREEFIALLSIASAMVGNSSGALFEGPSFALPAVNIGTRQEGRERAQNIIDALNEKAAIVKALKRALSPEFKQTLVGMQNPYQKEDAVWQIISILKTLDLSPELLKKKTVLPQ